MGIVYTEYVRLYGVVWFALLKLGRYMLHVPAFMKGLGCF